MGTDISKSTLSINRKIRQSDIRRTITSSQRRITYIGEIKISRRNCLRPRNPVVGRPSGGKCVAPRQLVGPAVGGRGATAAGEVVGLVETAFRHR
jgi:hypothetical protein